MSAHKTGERLLVVVPHQVDEDDDGEGRYADENDVAEIIGDYRHTNGEPYYNVGFPASGATGFYDEPELTSMFKPASA